MKVEMDYWALSEGEESSFVLELDVLPAVGQKIEIHQSLFPKIYAEYYFKEWPPFIDDNGFLTIEVETIEHVISANGRQLVRIDFDWFERSSDGGDA